MLTSALLLLTSLLAAEAPAGAVPVEGKPFAAALRSIDGAKAALEVGGKGVTLPLADLVRWGRFAEPTKGPLVLLADGSLVVADVFQADKERLVIDSNLLGAVRLPLESLAGVIFTLPAGLLERDRLLDRVLSAEGDADWLILENGDRVTGVLESIADDQIVFRAEVGELKLAAARVAALVFNPSLRAASQAGAATGAAPLRTWLGLSDGSRLLAADVRLDERALSFSAAGLAWKTQPGRLAALEPLSPRVVYLSDLKPSDYRHLPYLDLPWLYARDRSVSGGLLRCDGRLWLKGLGMHSTSRLSYALDGTARRFEADVGIDDGTEGAGSVRFRVFVDGQERFASETVRGRQPPVAVAVELSGAKRLDLVVDFADRADVLDRAVWLGARLIK